jgi:hypothetical protein
MKSFGLPRPLALGRVVLQEFVHLRSRPGLGALFAQGGYITLALVTPDQITMGAHKVGIRSVSASA